ncbi:hypothetical protein B0T14DRAFT_490017 [Immersiella caudata]|uniref:Uncharacterized protein n=1 Tax=Immersiella caudata TaxID=314043 RepID=A0AA39XDN1_9PEZI|nr:hypothetical protein B0T14DRAFT_490017 [Immersiella caudata]
MAAADLLFGVAFGRDVVILDDEDDFERDSTSIGIDHLPIICHPLFSPAHHLAMALELPLPTSLLDHPFSKEAFAQSPANSARQLAAKPKFSTFDDDADNDDSDIPLLLDRFSKVFERHEQIALALAGPDSRCQLPYQDYLPCPGSGPGSPAVSVATDYITPAAPVVVEPPQPEPQPTLSFDDIATASVSANNPMARYLSDMSQSHEWLAVVMEQPSTEAGPNVTPSNAAPRQDTPASSITLDGDHSLPEGSYLAAPVEGLTLSTTRKYEDEDEEILELETHTFEALATMCVPHPP